MPAQPTTLLAILNGSAALIGLYVTYRAYRAYRRSNVRFMFLLTAGLGILTAALVVEGFVFEVLGVPLAEAHVVEAAFNLVAFLVLAASLHASGPSHSEPADRGAPEEPEPDEGD